MKRRSLTPEQVATIRRLWATGASRDEIASSAGISIDTLNARRRDQLADLPARPRRSNSGRRGVIPTPEEIEAAAAEVRAGWPDERFLPEPLGPDFEIR